jgi:hypothetical protein
MVVEAVVCLMVMAQQVVLVAALVLELQPLAVLAIPHLLLQAKAIMAAQVLTL